VLASRGVARGAWNCALAPHRLLPHSTDTRALAGSFNDWGAPIELRRLEGSGVDEVFVRSVVLRPGPITVRIGGSEG